MEILDTTERTLNVSALVPISDGGSSGDFTTMEGSEVEVLLVSPSGRARC